jgi:hypothetical protein
VGHAARGWARCVVVVGVHLSRRETAPPVAARDRADTRGRPARPRVCRGECWCGGDGGS